MSWFMIGFIAVFVLVYLHDIVEDRRAYKIAMAKLTRPSDKRNQDWGP